VGNDRGILRTLVFVPAHDDQAVLAAAELGADAVCFDLEDLTPGAEKPRARNMFRDLAKTLAARGIFVMARANAATGQSAEADLDALVCPWLHAVNVPKVVSPDDVRGFCELLDSAEARNGVDAGATWVRPVIETAAGVKWAYEIAAASPRVEYMGGVSGGYWGDLGASLGVIPAPDGIESLYLRSKVLVDVRAAGVRFPIGGGVIGGRGRDAMREFLLQNKHLGYTGVHCGASAGAVALANEVFTPTADEITDWLRRVPVLEAARRDGRVAFVHDGQMYDTAGLDRTYAQLALARRLGLVEDRDDAVNAPAARDA
jgi:citrate lyase subunit beta/citryl-CoA lyase